MIVKVQLSLFTTSVQQRVLIYNENKSVCWEGAATPEVKRMMGSSSKAFFHAILDAKGKIVLQKRIKFQNYNW